MPRGKRTPRTYTGKAAKLNEKILQMEAQLKDLKTERDTAYKEQIRAEKASTRMRKTAAEKELIEAVRKYGEDPAKLIEAIKNKNAEFDGEESTEGTVGE